MPSRTRRGTRGAVEEPLLGQSVRHLVGEHRRRPGVTARQLGGDDADVAGRPRRIGDAHGLAREELDALLDVGASEELDDLALRGVDEDEHGRVAAHAQDLSDARPRLRHQLRHLLGAQAPLGLVDQHRAVEAPHPGAVESHEALWPEDGGRLVVGDDETPASPLHDELTLGHEAVGRAGSQGARR